MKPLYWLLTLVGAAFLLYIGLQIHDGKVRAEARAASTSDSLKIERKKSQMFRDSLAHVSKARDDSLAAQQQQQARQFHESQEARVQANRQINVLKQQIQNIAPQAVGTLALVDSLNSGYNHALALKDSVIASRDQSIRLYQRILSDKDQALLRLNQDLKASTTDADKWRKKAGEQKGLIHEVSGYVVKGLAVYGLVTVVRGR